LAVTLCTQVALVAQWIEHLTTDQKVVGSTPAGCTNDDGLVRFSLVFVSRRSLSKRE
jgi:hypothetical protein